MIRGLPLLNEWGNNLIFLMQFTFRHVDPGSGIAKFLTVVSVCGPCIVLVLVGNRAMMDFLCAAITDIRGFVQSVAAFSFKVLAGLITCRTGSAFHTTKNDLAAGIGLFTMVTMGTEVFSVIKSTFMVPVRQPVSFYLF